MGVKLQQQLTSKKNSKMDYKIFHENDYLAKGIYQNKNTPKKYLKLDFDELESLLDIQMHLYEKSKLLK